MLCLVTGEFPTRSETFVTRQATGTARRGWRVQVAFTTPGAGMAQAAIDKSDAAGIQRSYWDA